MGKVLLPMVSSTLRTPLACEEFLLKSLSVISVWHEVDGSAPIYQHLGHRLSINKALQVQGFEMPMLLPL
jgi:hypothetical protein